MNRKNIAKYVASSAKVIMTIIVFLFAVHILQIITVELSSEIYRMLTKTKRDVSAVEPTKQLSEAEKRLRRIHYSGKNFLPDGTIHLTYSQGRTPGRFDLPEKVQIYDVNDVLIWQGPESENPYEYLIWSDERFRPYRLYHGNFTERRMNELQMITPEFSQVIEIPVLTQDGMVQVWRYLPESDLFLGYRSDRSIIGFLGSTGFTRSKSEARPFGTFKFQSSWHSTGALEPTVLWQTSRRLYEINFHKRQVQLVFKSPQSDIKTVMLRDSRPIEDPQKPKKQYTKYRPTIRIVTEDDKHHLIMRNPEQKLTITFPDEKWSDNIHFAATEEDMFLIHYDSEIRMPKTYLKSSKLSAEEWFSKFEGKSYKRWVELYKVDNQAKFHLLNRYEWNVPSEFLPKRRKSFRLQVQRAAMAFSSPLYDMAWLFLGPEFFYQRRGGNDFVSGSIQMISELRPVNSLWSWLGIMAMVCIAFLHARPRQTSRPKLIFWLAFTLVFNLAGLLTYLALNHISITKCSACGKSRGLAQVNCVRCGAELPTPERRKLDLILKT